MSILAAADLAIGDPAIRRLSSLADLSPEECHRLHEAARHTRAMPPRRDFVTAGRPLGEARLILSGWACRTQILRDGRRQVLGFLLPGDLIGVCAQPSPAATAAVYAVTEVVTCPVPALDGDTPGLARAYAVSAAIAEHYLLRQITRLGRLVAYERVADWLMEVRERLASAGLAEGGRFPMPLTQELIADTLGLTSVHVNRTIRALRTDGLLTLGSGHALLLDLPRMEALVEHRPPRVTH